MCVQLDLASKRVGVCNTSATPLRGVRVAATWHDLSGGAHDGGERVVDVDPNRYLATFRARRPADLSRVHFLELRLTDGDGVVLADNVYWFSRKGPRSRDRFADLQQLRDAPVRLETSLQAEVRDGRHHLRARLRNPTDGIAFAVRPRVKRADGGPQPAFYGDGYVTLFGGQAREIEVEFDGDGTGSAAASLWVEGWNVAPTLVDGAAA